MKICNFAADGKPQTRTRRLCGKEWIEDLCSDRGIHSSAFIEDAHHDGACPNPARRVIGFDGYGPTIWHRLDCVSKEIHEELDDLTRVALDLWKIVGALKFDLHVLLVRSWRMDCHDIVK